MDLKYFKILFLSLLFSFPLLEEKTVFPLASQVQTHIFCLRRPAKTNKPALAVQEEKDQLFSQLFGLGKNCIFSELKTKWRDRFARKEEKRRRKGWPFIRPDDRSGLVGAPWWCDLILMLWGWGSAALFLLLFSIYWHT